MKTEGSTEKIKMGLRYEIYTIHNFPCVSVMLSLLLTQHTALQDFDGAANLRYRNEMVVGVSASGFLDGFSCQCVSVCVCACSDVFIFQLGS